MKLATKDDGDRNVEDYKDAGLPPPQGELITFVGIKEEKDGIVMRGYKTQYGGYAVFSLVEK